MGSSDHVRTGRKFFLQPWQPLRQRRGKVPNFFCLMHAKRRQHGRIVLPCVEDPKQPTVDQGFLVNGSHRGPGVRSRSVVPLAEARGRLVRLHRMRPSNIALVILGFCSVRVPSTFASCSLRLPYICTPRGRTWWVAFAVVSSCTC